MPSEQDLLELAAKSGKNDLAFLIKAKEDAKRRMSEDPSPKNIKAFEDARAAVEAEATRLQAASAPQPSVLTFAKQLHAVAFLQAQGFKVGKSKFNADVKAGKVGTNPEGVFESGALLAYAAVHLAPLAKAEHSGQVNASANALAASARLKDIQAQRQVLKLQREQGQLMKVGDHEADLAARAMFFRNELEGFGLRAIPALIQLVGGREDSLQEALEWWADQTAELMDAWAQDREFTTGGDDAPANGDEDLPGEELGEDMGGEA